ncbi:UDP-N-acetylmuramoyl-tripeptide--D-alanyl-D-alanine ligase [Zobellia amurskyensis]|uniref:UDP-N-acetylmuramoyl-tripeptide--D-alanyl-D-alanine ligase n=1 Tax=Zobellia amurskyensis TaxID=248905 RepID=A0A7X3D2C7_9FLAO|nr:UDP-N-acetylmuramoyl-tripeptide--D-alanyl-D-alanine ligase [Zobellia amurskyensis]MUH36336.1 UDP-N-acetylmuramoyl-tripeptide--D-alanyl-D-alanine ligase [Zobellia amurskyensis]
MKTAQLHNIFLEFPEICTDTRKIKENSIFFALKGDNFNGNKYASAALENGAAYAVIDEKEYAESDKHILVDDVLKTLQELASFHRNYSNARVIALTGSNGKTTTKELINAVLSKKYRTIATKGNLNNHIGVPLTLLSIKEDTEIAIVEMGANHQKEIEFLCSLALPDFGYITNFGKAHIEGFGSEEGVIKGKSELYDFLTKHNKHIFINGDDPIQFKKLGSYIKKYGFSSDQKEFYRIEFLGANPFVKLSFENCNIESQLIGSYNFTNCAAAILMGKYFNVGVDKIKDAIESYSPNNNRSQIISHKGHQIILDAYNANPTSMKAALENFAQMEGIHKVAFLGDMFELGEIAPAEHQNIANLARELNFDDVILVGENFYKTSTSYKKHSSFGELKDFLKDQKLSPESLILIKGSRGMALERILDVV